MSLCSFQSVPECDEARRISEEDDRGREEEEKEQEEDEKSDEGFMGMTPLLAHHAMEKMEEFVHKVLNTHTLTVPLQILCNAEFVCHF